MKNKKDKKNSVTSVKSRIEKFESTVNNIKDFIENHKQISDVEKDLLYMSFDTQMEFLDKKAKELQ